MGAFTDGQVVQYDQANQLLKGGPAFSSGFASGDVPVWNGSTFAPKQTSARRQPIISQNTNSTAYVDITALNVAINRTGQIVFEYWVFYITSNVTEGIGLQLAFTGTAVGVAYTIDMFTDPATRAALVGQVAFGAGVAPQAVGPAGTDACAYISGSCDVTAIGTLSCQMRSETGGAQQVAARVGSWAHVFAL
jgi:hypothetical protein